MVARYPTNRTAPVARRPDPSRRRDFRPTRRPPTPRPDRGYSQPLPPLPPGTKAALGIVFRRVAPRLVPGLGTVLTFLDVWNFLNREGGFVFPDGWTQNCSLAATRCVAGGTLSTFHQGTSGSSTTGLCYNQCLQFGPFPDWGSPVGGGVRYVIKYQKWTNPPHVRYHSVETWERVDPLAPSPAMQPGNATLAPGPLPSVFTNPVTWPIAVPLARPVVPAPAPLEVREPGEEPDNRPPEPSRNPDPAVDPVPLYRIPPVPTPFVVVAPEVERVLHPRPNDVVITQPDPSQPPVIVPDNTSPAVSNPPSRGTLQRKVNIAIVGGLVWTGINFTTEAFDFILAMHDALPPHLQLSSRASKRQKILHMTKNFELWAHIDIAEAIENYINMQVGDYVSALGSNQNRSLSRLTGNITGVDRAMSQHEKNIFEATGRSRSDFTPTLDIDMENGRVTLQWAGYDIAVYD